LHAEPRGKPLIAWGGLDSVLRLDQRAGQTPDSKALLSPERSPLTYLGLHGLLQSFRSSLLDAGLISGQSIAMVFPNGPDFVTTVLASCGLGACAPIDPSLTRDEFEIFFARLRAPVLLTLQGFETAAVPAARSAGMRVIHLKFGPDYFLDSLTSEGTPALHDVRVADASLLLFTSATTGRSKLVPLTAANLDGQWAGIRRSLELTERDVFLNLAPMFNLFGIGAVLSQVSSGGATVCVPEFDPVRLTGWVDQFRPTWISLNSVWHQALAQLVRQSPEVWKGNRLRFIRSGGAVPDVQVFGDLERALGVPILDSYGMTEAGNIAHKMAHHQRPHSVGPSSGTEIAIFDPSQNPVPAGEEGEVVIRGTNVMAGYLEDQNANHDAFTTDGWFRTGDLGKLDSEGFLFLTGRIKEIINRGGSKIIPQEVDRILLEHPEVADAAVFAVPHRTLGEEIAAAVVVRSPENPVSERALRNFVAEHAAAYKVPRHILFVEELPRGATGRVQRKKLSDQFRDLTLRSHEDPFPAPDEDTTARLIEVWKRILKVRQIELRDSFYDLGGDSISAALMIAEVQREFNIGPEFLDRIEFFDKPTAATLARIVVDTRMSTPPPRAEANSSAQAGDCRVVTLTASGFLPPVFCFPASDADPYYFRHLAKELGQDQPSYVICPPAPVEGRHLLTVQEMAARAVRAIRSKQPQGPYSFIGHCFGGVIAVETVRQLRAQAGEVPRLILVDSVTPGYPKIMASGSRYLEQGLEASRAVLRGKVLFSVQDIAAHLRRLTFLALRRFTARRSQSKIARGEAPAIDASSSQFLLNRDVLNGYDVPEIDVPVVHFLARDQKVDSLVLSDPRFGWRDFARAGLEERWVPGDHNSLLMNENARGLAAEIRGALGTNVLAASR
jgi:acyl-CoA synthetase (AMP-forming)/AMP-acid ligase II/thioesterase domain-containing protein